MRDSSSCGSRNRVVVYTQSRGYDSIVGGLPSPPLNHPPVHLLGFLEGDKPGVDLHGFVPTERKNVADWNRKFNQICVRKRLVDQIGVVDINRRVDGKFRNTLAIGGHCPIITTANCQLLTMRQTGSTCTKINGLGRMLGSDDTAAIQGVKWSSVQGLQSRRQLHISFGNMFPVNLAGVVLREVFDK